MIFGGAIGNLIEANLFQEQVSRLSLKNPQKDPKTQLQEYLQARGWSLPSYQILDVSGEAHQQSFRVECRIDELSLASVGTGNSRRRAEQAAANQLLERWPKVRRTLNNFRRRVHERLARK